MACGKNCGCSACKKKYGGGCRKRRRPTCRKTSCRTRCNRAVTRERNKEVNFRKREINKEIALFKKKKMEELKRFREGANERAKAKRTTCNNKAACAQAMTRPPVGSVLAGAGPGYAI